MLRRLGSQANTGVSTEEVALFYEKLLGRPSEAWEQELHTRSTSLSAFLRVLMTSDEFRRRARDLVSPGAPFVNTWTPELQAFHVPPGSPSRDGTSEVGREGIVFLNGGTNGPLSQFAGTYPLPDDWEDAWATAHRLRAAWAEELGVTLLWLVVPGKLAVLPELHVRLPPPGRRPVQRLLEDLRLPMLYPLEELRGLGVMPFLRADSHLNVYGGRALAAATTAALGAPDPVRHEELTLDHELVLGDIGSRFNPGVVEVAPLHGGWPGRVVHNSLEGVAPTRHFGTSIVIEHPEAPDPRTCVIFGDSFSNPVDASNGARTAGLASWLATVFREVHFIWAPFGWDSEYVRRVSPDVVISEGIERFAVRAPMPNMVTTALANEILRAESQEPPDPHMRDGGHADAPSGAVEPHQVVAVYEELLAHSAEPELVAAHLTARSLADFVDSVITSDGFLERVRKEYVEARCVNVWTPELERFAPPAGTVSIDEAVEVGRAGVLLPGERPAPWDERTAAGGWLDSWREGWAARAADCEAIRAQLVWLVVPDKVRCLGNHASAPVDSGPRPVERLVETVVPAPVDLLEVLRALSVEAFPRTDSRPSAAGVRSIAAEVVRRVAGPDLPPVDTVAQGEAFVVGDLGAHFRPQLGDVRPLLRHWPGTTAVADDGSRVHRHDDASDERRCLVFAEHRPHGLAWWLAWAFREVHVVPGALGWNRDVVLGSGADVVVVEVHESRCAEPLTS